VVTANCCGGNAEVVREALRYRPDLLLLQECPGTRETLDVLAEQPGYELVPGIDVSMAVRGSARGIPVERHHRGFIAAAEARVANRTVRVVNTHLVLPYHDLDLWDPHAWTAARQAQEARAEQMAAVWRYAEATPADLPLIVGGDFNAPAGDGLFRALKPRLRDSFRDAGRGLGNTITNEYPISRIDQVWVSRDLRVHTVLARRTRHSDHRLVVADVSFR
jgi:endonuclease/exonuclease/phosphatase family metal-dependent hydrolase